MLRKRVLSLVLVREILLVFLLCLPILARTQDAVTMLRAGGIKGATAGRSTTATDHQSFDFANHLIVFTTEIDDTLGTFVLDTGAPTLLVNHRGTAGADPLTGVSAGGDLTVTERYVRSFTLLGKTRRKNWALGADLRPFEERLDRPIDGFVGHDLLSGGELRIDYANHSFQLLKSVRRPLHAQRAPDHTFNVSFSDHLPVVTVRVGKKNLRLALDTGASVNVLSTAHRDLTLSLPKATEIQGLDGTPILLPQVQLTEVVNLPNLHQSPFALMSMSHLQSAGSEPIDGILGSCYLANFTIGIDYPRGKLYLWLPELASK